jgi:hypothetical protein
MNADTGAVIQSFPIGDRVDATVFQPKNRFVFSSTAEGIIHIFQQDATGKLRPVENINTGYGAKTMAVDTEAELVYTDTSDFAAPTSTGTEQQTNPQPTTVRGTCHLLIYARGSE